MARVSITSTRNNERKTHVSPIEDSLLVLSSEMTALTEAYNPKAVSLMTAYDSPQRLTWMLINHITQATHYITKLEKLEPHTCQASIRRKCCSRSNIIKALDS